MFVQLIAEDQMQRKHCFEIIVFEMYLSSLVHRVIVIIEIEHLAISKHCLGQVYHLLI